MSSVRAWCMAVCCVSDGRWRSSVRAWCMAVCCVTDGLWRRWMSSVRA